MQKLRTLHLYLGCIFAPMLLFFAMSGIWQTLGMKSDKTLALLSTLHTSHGFKAKLGVTNDLSSPLMQYFVVAMSLAFIVTTVLGIVMAFKLGRSRRAALYCLASGVVLPLVLVCLRLLK